MDILDPSAADMSIPVVMNTDAENALIQSNPFQFPRPTDVAVLGSTILAIDDEVAVTELVKKYLNVAGFERVETLNDANEAIDTIENMRPDLVLLDLKMQICGLEILEQLRHFRHLKDIPVITLTSDSDSETRVTTLNLGTNDFLTKPVNVSELVARVRNTLSEKVLRDQLESHSAKLESDILRDQLTQVANRRAFEYEITRRFSEWKRQFVPFGLLLIDIDYFKSVNDNFGHQAGDDCLTQVAQLVNETSRDTDLVTRYGGEEFAIILPHARQEEAKLAGERIRRTVEEHTFNVAGAELKLTVSVGVSTAQANDDPESLLKRADTAMYMAKRSGRNLTFVHDGEQSEPIGESDGAIPVVTAKSRQENDASSQGNIHNSKVLIVDDEPAVVIIARRMLNLAGYQCVIDQTDSTKAVGIIQTELPDIVLLDIRMPEINGMEILEAVRKGDETKNIPVVFMTSDSDTATRVKALELGANDFLTKPVNESELLARVKNTLLAKAQLDHLENYSCELEHEVRVRTAEVIASRREAIQCLARAAEIRDDQTGQHVFRVGRYAAIIGKELGFSTVEVEQLEHAAQLHDVGKIGIPDSVLKKPGGLTDEEFDIIKSHCKVGSDIILDGTDSDNEIIRDHTNMGASIFEDCRSPLMKKAAMVADSHHEKWDGSGYPNGLSGEDIPIEGRITAVADVFDALSSRRPYKEPMPLEKCFAILTEGIDSHFDGKVVDAFMRRKTEILAVYRQYNEAAEDNLPVE